MQNFPLQGYDVLMLAVLILSTVFGAWKGMAWQLAALASLLVSAAVAIKVSGPLAPYFGDQAPWNRCIAMLVLYASVSLVIWLLFRLVAGVIDRVKLKEFDRQMGAVFGAVKGVLWCLVITFFAVTLSEPLRQKILVSYSGNYSARLLRWGTPMLPEEVRERLGTYLEEFDRKLDPNTPPDASPEQAIRTRGVWPLPRSAGEWFWGWDAVGDGRSGGRWAGCRGRQIGARLACENHGFPGELRASDRT